MSHQNRPAFPYWNGRFFTLSFLFLTAISSIVLTNPTPAYAQDPQPLNRDEVALPTGLPNARQGQAIFEQNCAACHGLEGNSDGPVVPDLPAPPPQFSDPQTVWDQSPAAYFHITKFGRIENLMPPWGNRLSDDEIWHAAFYAWSLHTDKATVDAGQQLLDAALADVDEAARAEANALFTEVETLFRTQGELADELQSRLLDVDWTDTEMTRVLDYGRTLAYSPPWGAAFRAGNGSINGRVALVALDGSTNQPENDGNITVTIDAVSGQEVLATFDASVDETGQFTFADLSTNANISYYPQVSYNDIIYRGDPVRLSDSAPLAAPLLLVYETTDDPSGIMISRLNWVVDNAPGEVVIGQIMTLGNQLAATYTGQTVDGADRPVTTELSIPTGAYDIQFQDGVLGDTYIQVGDRFFDTAPVTPGDTTRQIFVSYRLAYEETATEIQQEVLYPVDALNLLIADLPALQEDVSALEFTGTNTVQNVSYRMWQGDNLSPQPITIALDGLIAADGVDPRVARAAANANLNQNEAANEPLATTTPPLDPMIPLAVGGLLTLLLVGFVIWPLRREQQTDPLVALESERAALISEIAALDDRHDAGKISDNSWTTKRAALKTRLLEVARELGEGEEKGEEKGEGLSEGVGRDFGLVEGRGLGEEVSRNAGPIDGEPDVELEGEAIGEDSDRGKGKEQL